MDFVQFLLRGHGHTSHGLTCVLLVEESAITDHERLDALVCTVEECLQSTARHTGYTDVLHVDLLVVGRCGVGILFDDPVDTLYLLLRARHRPSVIFVLHGDDSRCEDDISLRCNLVEEVHVLPG